VSVARDRDELTPRELEVLALLAAGQSDGEIAAESRPEVVAIAIARGFAKAVGRKPVRLPPLGQDGRGEWGSRPTGPGDRMNAPLGLIPVVTGNLIPLIGVVLFGWDLPSVLVMYWIETGVVGLVNVLKIHKAMGLGRPTVDEAGGIRRPIEPASGSGSWLLAVTWFLTYAVFWAILGVFVLQIASGGFYAGASRTGWTGASASVVVWCTASLVGGQLVGYVLDYVIGRRYLTVTSPELLRDPFVRIFVILATIAAGGVGIAVVGSPVGFLAAMVLAKTTTEIWFARAAPLVSP
jgi:Family of unknown function (DUF6498)